MGPQEAPVKQDAGLRLGFQPPPVKAEATDCRWQRISRRKALHSAFTPGPVLCGSGYVCHLFGIPGTPKNCVRIETMATSITNCLFAPHLPGRLPKSQCEPYIVAESRPRQGVRLKFSATQSST